MRRTLILLIALFASVASAKTYTVQQGDTLYAISQKTNVSLTRILMLNKINGADLKPGQVLQLPDDAVDTTAPAKATVQPAVATVKRAQPTISSRPSVSRAAYRHIGARYVYGASGPYRFDCSGFTKYVLKQYGVNLPHSAALQARQGRPVRRSGLMPGDLVFFDTFGRGISHVALYVGDNKVVHATNPRDGVVVSSLSERYWSARYVTARRVM